MLGRGGFVVAPGVVPVADGLEQIRERGSDDLVDVVDVVVDPSATIRSIERQRWSPLLILLIERL
ncbi:hypothetical protein CP556_14705 [Natrinema sp. CBA1119]|nr:hypothetical protein CP556_14705 [Natrinema sp. CBA1119]